MVERRTVAIVFHSDDDPHRTINAFSSHFCNRVTAARRSSFSMAAVCSFVAYADAALHYRNGGLLYLRESNLVGNHRYVCHLQLTQIAFKGISGQCHLRELLQQTATAQFWRLLGHKGIRVFIERSRSSEMGSQSSGWPSGSIATTIPRRSACASRNLTESSLPQAYQFLQLSRHHEHSTSFGSHSLLT